MKYTIYIIILVLFFSPLLAMSEQKPKPQKENKAPQQWREYREKVIELSQDEYEMLRIGEPPPSIKKKSADLADFEKVLQEHYPDEEKILNYIMNHAGEEELVWLMKLRLAESHFINGNIKKSKEIYEYFLRYLKRQEQKKGN